ncbi:MAG TPA: hypothetical protein PLY40_04100 [Bacillota bacterium]|nr:hypothetical protein [Bacillota bacterium]
MSSLELELSGKTGMDQEVEQELFRRIAILEENTAEREKEIEPLKKCDWILAAVLFACSILLVILSNIIFY